MIYVARCGMISRKTTYSANQIRVLLIYAKAQVIVLLVIFIITMNITHVRTARLILHMVVVLANMDLLLYGAQLQGNPLKLIKNTQ